MLDIARIKSETNNVSAKWLHADIRDFSFDEKFDLIFISGNSICHLLTLDDFEKCLKCVKNHLAHNGKFIIDVFVPSVKILSRDENECFPFAEFQDAETGENVTITSSARYDAASQINHVRTYHTCAESLKTETGSLTMRMYFPQELLALVKYNGFKTEHRFGDYSMSPFDENLWRQILVLNHSTH
jgi:SAM-dependent methyltransferase